MPRTISGEEHRRVAILLRHALTIRLAQLAAVLVGFVLLFSHGFSAACIAWIFAAVIAPAASRIENARDDT